MARPSLPISVIVAEDGGETLQEITNAQVKVDGVELRLKEWSGWSDTPSVLGNPEQVPNGDGTYDDGPLFDGRTLILKGVAYADTSAALLRIERTFNRLLAGSIRSGVVKVTQVGIGDTDTAALLPSDVLFPSESLYPSEGGGESSLVDARQCSVRLGGPTTFDKTHPRRAEWSMSLYAKDPRRYSQTLQTGETSRYMSSGGMTYPRTYPRSYGAVGNNGTIECTNNGDIPTGVQLSILGAGLNPTVVLLETGERISLQAAVDGNVQIDTNTTTRSVLRDGAPYGYVLTSDSVFFQLPKGVSTLLFLADSGAPILTASWRDTTP